MRADGRSRSRASWKRDETSRTERCARDRSSRSLGIGVTARPSLLRAGEKKAGTEVPAGGRMRVPIAPQEKEEDGLHQVRLSWPPGSRKRTAPRAPTTKGLEERLV